MTTVYSAYGMPNGGGKTLSEVKYQIDDKGATWVDDEGKNCRVIGMKIVSVSSETGCLTAEDIMDILGIRWSSAIEGDVFGMWYGKCSRIEMDLVWGDGACGADEIEELK